MFFVEHRTTGRKREVYCAWVKQCARQISLLMKCWSFVQNENVWKTLQNEEAVMVEIVGEADSESFVQKQNSETEYLCQIILKQKFCTLLCIWVRRYSLEFIWFLGGKKGY